MDKYFKLACSEKYLKEAFQHLKGAQNTDYKNYYRDLLISYEIALEENIESLSHRLSGHSYRPSSILRLYKPKYSGLHRPLTLLHVEDLIVYQSLAIVYAIKFIKERKQVEYKNVFSNILNTGQDKEIFVLHKWQTGYRKYISRITSFHNSGNHWVAHFDLAAFYDTIDHILLAEQFSKSTYTDYTELLKKCLSEWSTHKSKKFNHGIPQGPVSSNILSDIFLLPIDKVMAKNKFKYLRYVDDIRLFGKTRDEVLNSIIVLEKECRERGLIPQSKKYVITEASSVEEAIGKFPSISNEEKTIIRDSTEEDKSGQIFMAAFNENNFDISKVKYLLRTVMKNEYILDIVIRNIIKYPELSDEFTHFLQNYIDNDVVITRICRILRRNPFQHEYAEGRYWEFISLCRLTETQQTRLLNTAFARFTGNHNHYSLKFGLYVFICSTGNSSVIKWISNESSSLLQSFIISKFSESCYHHYEFNSFMEKVLSRSNNEPALILLKEAIAKGFTFIIDYIAANQKDHTGILCNTLGKPGDTDSIGDIIKSRYKVKYCNLWKKFLDDKYEHANRILYLADKAYHNDRNAWVNYSDAFNDIVLRKLVEKTIIRNPTKNMPQLFDKNGGIVEMGRILKSDQRFRSEFPEINDLMLTFHERRSKTPASHAYDKKTQQKTSIITGKEQKELNKVLSKIYYLTTAEIIKIFS